MLALCLSLLVQAQPVVVSLDDPKDTAAIPSSIRVVEVRDLRRMAAIDPAAIGVATLGVFEERAPLRTKMPVMQEVGALCRKWMLPSEGALRTRLEILSLESWSKPVDGLDPFYALARIRLVSLDSSRPGVLLSPEARSERKGVTTSNDQAAMLAGALRDALAMVRPDMKPVAGSAMPVAPAFDPWADPRQGGARDSLPMRLKHAASLFVVPGWNTMSMGLRYNQNMEPQPEWTHGYWAGVQVRAPWTKEDFTDIWSGEAQGGMTWWKRLDDGRSNWATTSSVGGILGTEQFRRVYKDSLGARFSGSHDYWVYLGGELRSGLRWSERTESGLVFEGGLFSSLRIPSSIAYFDLGAYFSSGWRF